jgi:hypothetical protein
MSMNAPDLLHRLMNVRSTVQTEAIMVCRQNTTSGYQRRSDLRPGSPVNCTGFRLAATAVMVDASSWQGSR